MKKKIWKYHVSHSFIHKGKEYTATTQLYLSSVYMIINNDPRLQTNTSPQNMVKMEKTMQKDSDSGVITDLKFGREITVTEDENGLFVEVQ